jgi:hypothetical protein
MRIVCGVVGPISTRSAHRKRQLKAKKCKICVPLPFPLYLLVKKKNEI